MALTREQKLGNQFMYAQAIGIGLQALLTTSILEQVRLTGGDPDKALKKVQELLDQSLKGLLINLPDNDVSEEERKRIEADIQRRVGIILNETYQFARNKLGLTPPTSSQAH